MINQLQMTHDGQLLDKVEIAIKRLREFEPQEGYYVAFSGGKDSQCVYHLCKLAGVKFDAHYAVTSVDPPELVRFIKTNYKDVLFERRHDSDGKLITMWNLIEKKHMPPTRLARYCCSELKETQGEGRIGATGVRWAESVNRRKKQGLVTITDVNKRQEKQIQKDNDEIKKNQNGGIVLNLDNDAARRTVEFCYRTNKTLLNPIIDWEEEDVWEFLNSNDLPHCCLYDEGFKRLGCIGCPMGRAKNMRKQFERWPKYKELYLKAFGRMLQVNKEQGVKCSWNTPEEVMSWWMQEREVDE